MVLEYTREINFTTCDFNNYEELTPFAILNSLQSIAGKHGEMCGVGFYKMLAIDLIWVLAKTKFKIIKQPQRDIAYDIKTWPREPRRFEAIREYLISKDGETYIKATSKWCLINIKTNRLNPCSGDMFNGTFSSDVNFEDGGFDIIPFEKEQLEYVFSYTVRASDLDRNQHMNNARYGYIVYDAINLKKEEYIDEFQIDYVNQAYLGDEIKVYTILNDKQRLVYGLKGENLVFKARVDLA